MWYYARWIALLAINCVPIFTFAMQMLLFLFFVAPKMQSVIYAHGIIFSSHFFLGGNRIDFAYENYIWNEYFLSQNSNRKSYHWFTSLPIRRRSVDIVYCVLQMQIHKLLKLYETICEWLIIKAIKLRLSPMMFYWLLGCSVIVSTIKLTWMWFSLHIINRVWVLLFFVLLRLNFKLYSPLPSPRVYVISTVGRLSIVVVFFEICVHIIISYAKISLITIAYFVIRLAEYTEKLNISA